MKVAIDAGPLTSGDKIRGIGAYTRGLIASLKRTKGMEIDAFDFSTNAQKLSGYDIVHYPYFRPFFITLPFRKVSRTIVTIHDLIPLIYPKHYPPGIRGKINFLIQRFLIKNVDAIITDSETSKKDIVRFLGVKSERICVVRLAAGNEFRKIKDRKFLNGVKEKYRLPDKFVLYVGDVNYNKNIPGLIRACRIAKMPLVICGKQASEIEDQGGSLETIKGPKDWIRFLLNKPHPELAHYTSILKAFEGEGVQRLGFVPTADLVGVYNLATLYCQPSFYEGFGIPVLEAIACGTPVVVSRTQALVEIAEGAATFVDPKNPKEMADGFGKLVRSPKLRREYLWEKVASETADVYQSLMK